MISKNAKKQNWKTLSGKHNNKRSAAAVGVLNWKASWSDWLGPSLPTLRPGSPPTYLQKVHLQSPPFQWATRDLKWLKLLVFRNSSGKLFHKTAAAYLNDFLPYVVVLTCGTCKMFVYLKLYLFSFSVRQSCKQGGAIPCTILNASMAIVLIRRNFNDGILALSRRSS